MKRKAGWLVMVAAPSAAVVGLLACSDDTRPTFVATPDGESDSPVSPPEAGVTPDDAGSVDARVQFDASDEPVHCTATPCVTQLVAGSGHFCVLLEDKTVRCWGITDPALGNVEGPNQTRPIALGLSNVEQISAGGFTTCARLTDGTVQCWGGNRGNELGLDPPYPDYWPHDPAPVFFDGGALDGIARVDVGKSGAVYATKTSGELWSWGDNSKHVLARPREINDWGEAWLGAGPVTYLDGTSVMQAGGYSFSNFAGSVAFAITNDRHLLTWGTSTQMVPYPGPVPVVVDGLENVSSAGVTSTNICAVADGRLYCWGQDGLLACTNSPHPVTSPVAIRTQGTTSAQQVSLGLKNTCVRLIDGTVECCGDDERGQLGRSSGDAGAPAPSDSAPMLTRAEAFTGHAVQVAVAERTVCALVQGGTVLCWGDNERGQLGQGTLDDKRHPAPVTVHFE